MKDKDILLRKAQSLATDLKGVDSSEFKKAAQFLIRNRNLEKFKKLLNHTPPPRGKARSYWRSIREKIEKRNWSIFSVDEAAYILGWTFRFMKYQGD
ncbi:MAG: hypothetical protein DRI93_01360 [Aquificota bacterium]|nr:MAG: hypothetical protein DRI93_01360 [Aquificota bacterium]